MLSFKPFCDENEKEIKEYILSLSDGEGEDEICDIIDFFLESADEDTELSVTFAFGCLLFRIFDMGRYVFPFPYEISSGADIGEAIEAIAEYAMREEIELVFVSVPGECLTYMTNFRHMNIDMEGRGDEATFRVRVLREIDLIDEVPTLSEDSLSLAPLTEDDIPAYARLSRDESSLKYWGYDYREDNPEAADEWFYEIANREFNTGAALTLAVRHEGVFVGECIIYGFMGNGRAEIAVRILPEYRGRGIGTSAMRLGVSLAGRIGLTSLYALVFCENTHSVRMMEHIMDKVSDDGIRAEFCIEI